MLNRRDFLQAAGVLPLAFTPLRSQALVNTSAGRAKMQALRADAVDKQRLPYDLASRRLGIVSMFTINAPDCTVWLTSGPENRLLGGSVKVQVTNDPIRHGDELKKHPEIRQIELSVQGRNPEGSSPTSPLWFRLDIATADYLYVKSPNTRVFIDGLSQAHLTLNHHEQDIWFEGGALESADIQGNGKCHVGGTASFVQLSLANQVAGCHYYAHAMRVKQLEMRPTSRNQFYAVRIAADAQVTYYNPASTPSNVAKLYTVEVLGDANALQYSGPGRASVTALTETTKQAALALRERVVKDLVRVRK